MIDQHITIEQLRDLIHQGEATDPLVFLESIMMGKDPRDISRIYSLIIDIHEFSGGEPTKEDWLEVVDYVEKHQKYKEVSMSESRSAAVTLSEYIHAKRKTIDINDPSSLRNTNKIETLTEEEIELFKEKFNDEF